MRIKPVENLYFGAYLPHKQEPQEPQEPQELDYSKIDDVAIENIDHNDYPDFSDAYVASAWYDDNGNYRELTQSELENLDSEWVSEQVWDWIH